MIRQAKLADLDDIFTLGQKMLDRVHGPGVVKVDPQQGRKDMRFLMNSKTAIVLVDRSSDGELLGVLAGQVVKQSFVDLRFATDLAFYVQEDHPITAVKLLRHFINWAKGQPNVREILIQVSTGLGDSERMTTMYEKLGLRHMGGCFSVWLGGQANVKSG